MAAQKEELLVIKRGYDFSKWLLHHTGKYPKSYRFSLATKMENAILEFIELTTAANMQKEKLPLLKRADETLARLRLLLRGRDVCTLSGVETPRRGASTLPYAPAAN